MNFEITSGVVKRAQKVVVYGVEGIGKSTLASKFPDPLFIDTEGSTSKLDVKRLPKPTSYQMLNEEIKHVISNPNICKTLVIDTIDWAEQLIIDHILNKHQKSGIEDFGYGNGYVYAKEEVARFLHLLDDAVDVGVNVLLLAHAQIRKFEQPDEMGAYDRYELKLGKKTSSQTAPLVKEWADMVFFTNYKTYSIATDKEGKKHKAQGGQRVMYTTHHPCWDAKNRDGLPEELSFDYSSIAHLFSEQPVVSQSPNTQVVETIKMEQPIQSVPIQPQALLDLMNANMVVESEIREVVARKGYFPLETPIVNYGDDFINGVLIAAWPKVWEEILKDRNNGIEF